MHLWVTLKIGQKKLPQAQHCISCRVKTGKANNFAKSYGIFSILVGLQIDFLAGHWAVWIPLLYLIIMTFIISHACLKNEVKDNMLPNWQNCIKFTNNKIRNELFKSCQNSRFELTIKNC